MACYIHSDESLCQLIKYALEFGASPNKGYTKNTNSYPLLYILCEQYFNHLYALSHQIPGNNSYSSKEETFQCLQSAIQMLLDKGADINEMINEDNSSYTLLYYICNHKEFDFDLLQFIVGKDADINKESLIYINNSTKQLTPLYALCSQKYINVEAIEFLVEKGADVNKGSITPLYQLCTHEYINYEAVQILKNHGANITEDIKNFLKQLENEEIKCIILKGQN